MATKVLIAEIMPLFIGLKYIGYPWASFRTILGIIYILLSIFLLIGIFRLKDKRRVSVLIIFTALACISFIFSRWGGLGSPRYLFPLYSILPILISFSLLTLKGKSRASFYALSGIIISANLYAAVDAYSASSGPSERDPDTKGLIQFLKSKGVLHAYSDYGLAPRLTFESKEEIICAEPTTERYKRYKEILDASYNFAYVFRRKGSPLDIEMFEDNLKAIGVSYRRDDIDAFRVFHSFSPPPPKVEIPRKGWRVESNFNREGVEKAIDGDIWSRWCSGEPKKDGMWFIIDMGRPYMVSGVSLLPGNNPADTMVGYSIQSSLNKSRWSPVTSLDYALSGIHWERGGPRFDEGGRLKISFKPVYARYIRIDHKGSDPISDWSIGEIFLYEGQNRNAGLEKEVYRAFEEGKSLEENGEYGNAMRRYFNAIRLYGDIEEAYYRLMVLGQRLNIPEGPFYRRGLAFERYGLIEKAIEDYERVLSKGSYSTELIRRLAGLNRKIGDEKRSKFFERMLDEFSLSERREVIFGDTIEFIGYDIDKKEIAPGKSFHITYYWKAVGRVKKDWIAFVHFIDPEDNIDFQNDHPIYSGYNDSRSWIKGEIYKERFRVKVPEDARPGDYRIVIGLCDPKTGERLKVTAGLLKRGDEMAIGELRIK